MIKFSKKQFIIAGIILIFLITLIILNDSFEPKPVQSASTDNVSGWAWGGGDDGTSAGNGWISFNCTDSRPGAPGGICGTLNYGVNVNPATGNFSGYAWMGGGRNAAGSDVATLGWINFAPSDPYPAAPNYSACLDMPGITTEPCNGIGNYRVAGWAKVIAADGNGWDGWIKLGDGGVWPGGGSPPSANSQVYVQTQAGPDEFRGWAWGSDVVGWISFNCADQGVCGSSPYKVLININFPPSVTCNDAEIWNYCSDSKAPTLSWNYSDPDSDPQESYWIQIDNNSGFSSPEIDTEERYSSGNTYHPSTTEASNLNWNTTYYWHVRVKDSNDSWSIYSSNCSFITPIHAYPDVDFSLLPSKPSALEPVQFTDETEFYNGANSWNWTFENAVPVSSVLQNPVATFSSPGNWDVTLEATDSDSFMCPITKNVNVSLPLPEWKEIIPR